MEGGDALDTLEGIDAEGTVVCDTTEVLVASDDSVALLSEKSGDDSVGTCLGESVSSAVIVGSATLTLTLGVIVGAVIGDVGDCDCVMTASSAAYRPIAYSSIMSRYSMG